MRTINDEWQSYKRDVLPDDASQIQITETERAFYAGAKAVLYLLRLFDALKRDNAYPVLLDREANQYAAKVDGLE